MDKKELLFEIMSPQLYGEQYKDILTYWLPSVRINRKLRLRGEKLRLRGEKRNYDNYIFTDSRIVKVNSSDGPLISN